MLPIMQFVESRAFETLGGIPQLTGRQIGVVEHVSSHQPSSCSGHVHGRVQSLQFRFRGQKACSSEVHGLSLNKYSSKISHEPCLHSPVPKGARA